MKISIRNLSTDRLEIHPSLIPIIEQIGIITLFKPASNPDHIESDRIDIYLATHPPVAIEDGINTYVIARIESLLLARQTSKSRIPIMLIDKVNNHDARSIFASAYIDGPVVTGCHDAKLKTWTIIRAMATIGENTGLGTKSKRQLAQILNVDRRRLR